MDFAQVIKDRYSCKKYDGKPVTAEQLSSILEAGRLAPTPRTCRSSIFMLSSPLRGWLKLTSSLPAAMARPQCW